MHTRRRVAPACHLSRLMALCVLAATAWAAAPSAHAGRPLVTEDAGVLDRGECELELYGSHQRLRPAGRDRGISLQGSCGVGHGVQAALAWERSRVSGNDDAGRSDTGVASFKARLIGDDDDDPALTLVGAADWGRSGSDAFRRDSLSIGLAGSMPLAEGLTAHANLGHLASHADHQRSTLWALAIEKAATDTLDLGAEVFGDDHGKPWAGLGLRWAAMPQLKVGTSVAAQSGSGRARLFTLGVTLGF